MVHVMNQNRAAICSLAAAGVLWGLSVPLSKLSLAWLTPGWLTAVRFAAAAPLLAFAITPLLGAWVFAEPIGWRLVGGIMMMGMSVLTRYIPKRF